MKVLRLSNLAFVIVTLAVLPARADYSTPGIGVDWTMDQLVANAGGAVTGSGGAYQVHASVIMSVAERLDRPFSIRAATASAHAKAKINPNNTSRHRAAELPWIVFCIIISIGWGYGVPITLSGRDMQNRLGCDIPLVGVGISG